MNGKLTCPQACDICQHCMQLVSNNRVVCNYPRERSVLRQRPQSDCIGFKMIDSIVYVDTDSIKYVIPSCTILWRSGETTYLKGKNALRIAKHWLYTDDDCLLVYTPGWIYLKPGDKITS